MIGMLMSKQDEPFRSSERWHCRPGLGLLDRLGWIHAGFCLNCRDGIDVLEYSF
jgi:hypothetical protein